MSNLPFGFGVGDDDERRRRSGDESGDPFGGLLGGFGMGGGDLGAALQHIGRLLQWQGGPVNWDLARDVARQLAVKDGDPSVSAAERRDVEEALRLADLWLDQVTDFPAVSYAPVAWSRSEWVEGTAGGWSALVEPVAERVVDSVGSSMQSQVPPEMAAMVGQLSGMMRQVGGAMFGAQVGQAIGQLSTEVTSSTDVGLPLAQGRLVLVPSGVRAFGDGLGLSENDVRVYLALREVAHQRLHARAPWLRSRIVAAVEEYARGIVIDPSRLESAMGGIDPASLQSMDPESMQSLTESLFTHEDTPAQEAVLARLETLLALIEGWVDLVVHQAASAHLPSAEQLRETMRRRRALGGPAEATFAALVGLKLRPRRLRDAATLWATLEELRGVSGRDEVWSHPDLLPSADDLDDPQGYAARSTDEAMDAFDLSALEDSAEPEPPADETGSSH
ncbi:MAG: zinc-dependent metalloprotease [Actinomycetes bacterium]